MSADDPHALVLVLSDKPPSVTWVNDISGIMWEGGDNRHLVAQGGQLLSQFGHYHSIGRNVRGEVKGQQQNSQCSIRFNST